MKYYEMHEIVYRKLRTEGVLSWDKSETFDEMWLHTTNVYLEKLLTSLGLSLAELTVLDLGTGSGTSALFTALKGAKTIGVEISSSAIEMASANAKLLGLDVEFIQGDALELDLNKTFDIVIDSTILHCIVGSQDRARFYNSIKRHMKEDSYLLINTMIASGDMSSKFPEEYFTFRDDVLWSLGMSEINERKTIDGKSYFPHRTILSEAKQLEEFQLHNFKIIRMEQVSGSDGDLELVALLKLK